MKAKSEGKTGPNGRRQLQGLPLMRTDVAGMDIGSERHWVCAATEEGSGREIGDFGATTSELIRMAEWLKARRVKSVAMESTGVYLDTSPRGVGGARSGSAAGGHTATGASTGKGQEDRSD
jgi:hypothetical protein